MNPTSKILVGLLIAAPFAGKAQLHLPAGEVFHVDGSLPVSILEDVVGSGKVVLKGSTLHLGGGVASSAAVSATSGTTNSLVFVGAPTNEDFYSDQTTAGTTNNFQNITVERTGSSGVELRNDLQVTGIVTLTSGDLSSNSFLTLKASGPSVYAQIAGSGTGTISGNATVEKVISSDADGWRQFSLPVATAVGNLNGLDLLGTAHNVPSERNLFYWNGNHTGNNTALGWTAATIATDNHTKAYTVWSDNDNPLYNIQTNWSIIGVPNHGDINVSLHPTADPNGSGNDAVGWNLIPNPYPSNLNISDVFDAPGFPSSYKAIHRWDRTAGQYKALLKNGVSLKGHNTHGGGQQIATDDLVISPFQAFWVKADQSASLTLKNAQRTTSMAGVTHYFKTEPDLVRLNVFRADSSSDQTVVYADPQGDLLFDESLDGYKLFTPVAERPSLYVAAPGAAASIKAFESEKSTHTFPLGVRVPTSGPLSFALDPEGYPAHWSIYLGDVGTFTLHNLRESSYRASNVITNNNRFILYINQNGLSADENEVFGSVASMIPVQNGVQFFLSDRNLNSDLNYRVTNLSGQTVLTGLLDAQPGQQTLDLSNLPASVYVVQAMGGVVKVSTFR